MEEEEEMLERGRRRRDGARAWSVYLRRRTL